MSYSAYFRGLEELLQFSDGRFPLRQEEDGAIGFIDKTGKFVIEPQYDEVGGFKEGFSLVCQSPDGGDRRCSYINPEGETLIEGFGTFFRDGIAILMTQTSYKSREFAGITPSFQLPAESDRFTNFGHDGAFLPKSERLLVQVSGCPHSSVQSGTDSRHGWS